MSIIYDALKKTQKAREKSFFLPEKKRTFQFYRQFHRLKKPFFAVFILIMAVAAFYMVQSMLQSKMHASNLHLSSIQLKWPAIFSRQPKKIIIAEADFRAKHFLNGVFISDYEIVAMINNKLVHMGDNVDGMQVASIDTYGVQLRHDDQVFFLRTIM